MTPSQFIHDILQMLNIVLFSFVSTGAYVCLNITKHLNTESLEHGQFVCIGLSLTMLSLYILIYGLR